MLVRTTFELPDPEDDSLGVDATGGDDSGRNPILNVLAVLFIKGKVVLTGVGFKQITARLSFVPYSTATWIKPYTGTSSPGRRCHSTLRSLAVIGCHSLGIRALTLLPLLSFSVTITVSPRARHQSCLRALGLDDVPRDHEERHHPGRRCVTYPTEKCIVSFLHKAIKPMNELHMMEDSLVIIIDLLGPLNVESFSPGRQ
jgi:hypothetical protein